MLFTWTFKLSVGFSHSLHGVHIAAFATFSSQNYLNHSFVGLGLFLNNFQVRVQFLKFNIEAIMNNKCSYSNR